MIEALTTSADDEGLQQDMFGQKFRVKFAFSVGGYAAMPGSGPDGCTCGGCTHYRTVQSGARTHPRCALTEADWTHGKGSDIRRGSPACARYSDRAAADRAKLEPFIGAYALSIRAPWPAWIMGTKPDRKRYENRVWRPSCLPRYRGPVLVHLAQWWSDDEVCDTIEQVGANWRKNFCYPMCAGIPDVLSTPRKLRALRGHLLGWVDLVDIRPGSELAGSFWTYDSSPPNHHCLVLDNPRMLEAPVACKGALGLFKVKS